MSSREVNLELMSFVETNILPQYNNIEPHHGLSKILNIIKQSLQLARITAADINMAYTIAAYHDLGLNGPKAIHHITGGKILSKDARLLNWFSKEQITTMKEAIEDHRASMAHAPRSIYGCIIAESVRDLSLETVFKDTITAIRQQYPNSTKEE
ncbi:MAG: phosphohydrolase, partial [Prevotella nanceiensis]|nr:phosphohydrolase [Hoylesella nanceiensis]